MRIILIGASGHGKVCAEIAELSGKYDELFFLDDDKELTVCGSHPVVGVTADFKKYLDDRTEFFVSIGNADSRKRIQEDVENANGRIATLLHLKAMIGKDVQIGDGSIVMAGAVINIGSKIGRGVIVNTCSSIDHDCTIGDYVHVAVGSHVCGTVNVSEGTWIGAGAIINNNVNICGGCTIGAGAVVIKDINLPGIYVGVPGKRK